MERVILFLAFFSIQKHFSVSKYTEATAAIETRIELLKREIYEEIHAKQNRPRASLLSDHYSDMYEYIDNGNRPITPIMDFDKRKLKERYKLPEIRSTPTPKYVASDTSPEVRNNGKPLRSKKHKVFKKSKTVSRPKEVFYRKMFADAEERNKPQKWTHCLDLVTPFLNGYKDNVTSKHVLPTDGTVVRLAQLLSVNVTDATKDDIRSILYQISNLQLRIFQWDVNAIKVIFSIIIKDGTYDFRGLKNGLKAIFHNWKLDLSDISSFIKQSRIFRPPCVQVSEFSGSTLTPKAPVRYTKPDKKKCPDEDDDECSA